MYQFCRRYAQIPPTRRLELHHTSLSSLPRLLIACTCLLTVACDHEQGSSYRCGVIGTASAQRGTAQYSTAQHNGGRAERTRAGRPTVPFIIHGSSQANKTKVWYAGWETLGARATRCALVAHAGRCSVSFRASLVQPPGQPPVLSLASLHWVCELLGGLAYRISIYRYKNLPHSNGPKTMLTDTIPLS
jgi:hypothetical protein